MSGEQRYTPVPGMGQGMTQSGGSLGQGRRASTGFELDDFYDGNIPAAHRLSSYSDPLSSRPNSLAARESVSSYHDLPLATGGSGSMSGMTMAPAATYATRDANPAYQNIPSEQYWAESTNQRGYGNNNIANPGKGKRKFWYWTGGVLLLVALIIGVVVGVVVAKGKKDGKSASASSASTSATLSDPDDPSSFAKDDRLHQSFWAIAYTPQGAQPPACGGSLVNTTRDIQLLSQLTTRLRLYGANCNETALVLQAIRDTKVNMTIWPAIYIDSNTDAYTTQLTAVQDALKTYGTDNIEGIIVGNEYILNTAESLTSAAYSPAVSEITTKVTEVKSMLKGLNLSKTLPVGTSDAGSLLSTSLASGIDFFMANVHPWFGSLAIQDAAAWTNSFFQEFDVDVAATASNNPATYIAETGWPSASSNASEASDGAGSPQGDASVANLQTFLDTFVCQANTNETHYFYFEAFDEPWKEVYGGVEPHWGLFDSDRNLKNLTIPTCS